MLSSLLRSRSGPWVLAVVVAAFAAGAVLVVFGDDGSDATPAGAPTEPGGLIDLTPQGPDADLIEIVTTDYDGSEVAFGDRIGTGTPLVVNFFASWCVPCVTEMPEFEAVFGEVSPEVDFLGVAMQDRAGDSQRIVEQTGVTYGITQDLTGDLLNSVGGLSMPTTVFVDADGTVVEVHSGPLSESQLRDRISEHFGVSA